MSLAEFVDAAPVLSLEARMDQLALEASFLNNMIDTFKSILPDLSGKLKSLKQSFSGMASDMSEEQYNSLDSDQKAAIKKIAGLKFLLVGENIVDIPESFTGNLAQYMQVLTKVNTQTFKDVGPAIIEYTSILSSFATNKDDKVSLKDHTAFFQRIAKQREQYEKALNGFFKVRTDRSITKIKNVFSNCHDMENFILDSVDLAKSQDPIRLKQLQNEVQGCVDLLDIIIRQVNDSGVGRVSPEATKNIAQGAFEVAKYVELIGINYYRGIVLLHAQKKLAYSLSLQ